MLLRSLAIALTVVCALPAAVRRIHVVERADIPGYAYERILAKVDFTVDPKLPANAMIRDLEFAPRNEEGLVEFSADLFVVKPRDPAKGNGTILFEVSNRGGKGMLNMFSFGRSTRTPASKEDYGDGLLLDAGYTLVWLGWQPDVPMENDLLRLYAPVAKKDGKPITGVVRAQWVPDRKIKQQTLADRTHIAYAAIEEADARLTVQDSAYGGRREVPKSQWRFGREEAGKVVADQTMVYMASGFEPGKMYELVYTAKDPIVVGLGSAGIRDLISFLRYENNGVVLLGDQSRYLKRAIGFGTSQSGRFLRTFLYNGFNADEKGRKVFDGVWAHVAGAGRGSFNHRFAQPSRDGHPYMNTLYPTDIFPFTDLPQKDEETGIREGLLDRAQSAGVVPKIFYTNGSYEYWGRAAGLIHTAIDGKSDYALPDTTRVYFLTGTQHGAGSFPPGRNNTQHLSNPNDYRPIMRALLAAMNAWISEGKEPPASKYPRIDKDELVTRGAVNFPKIPGASLPEHPQQAWRADYGPEFRADGIVSKEPPALGTAFPTLLPQVDVDGNETAGIRLPEVQVPLGTYTGWNLRTAEIGAPKEIFSMVGSFWAFPKTAAEARQAGDPRKSIAERYPSREVYLDKIRAAAQDLVSSGYLLPADVPRIEERATAEWEALAPK